jgi:hypothetical protein
MLGGACSLNGGTHGVHRSDRRGDNYTGHRGGVRGLPFLRRRTGCAADLTDRYPLTIETVSVRSADGRELMARHRAALSPLVLLDGAFFSHGRLPRRRLIKVLQARHGRPTGQTATKVG